MNGYTLGKESSYDVYMSQDPIPQKLGYRPIGDSLAPEGCEGGSVWKTPQEAQTYIDNNNLNGYAVYLLIVPEGDWDDYMVGPPDTTGMYNLLIDCQLICKVKND